MPILSFETTLSPRDSTDGAKVEVRLLIETHRQ